MLIRGEPPPPQCLQIKGYINATHGAQGCNGSYVVSPNPAVVEERQIHDAGNRRKPRETFLIG